MKSLLSAENLKKIKFDWGFLTLVIVAVVACFVFVGHYNNVLIDFGREVYYPERILQGKVLYKDLFNIYGPFSYLMNAVLYKIFGVKLSTLYVAGSLLGICLVGCIYKIARIFLKKTESFVIGLLTVAVGICTTVIFNITFPYSWAMLYGTVFFAFSLYFMLKSIEKNSDKYGYMALFFGGLALSNKYEFLLYGIFLGFFVFKTFGQSIKKMILAIFLYVLPIILSFGALFIQGLGVSDLISAFGIVKTMAGTLTLKYFYVNHGNWFSLKAVGLDLVVLGLVVFINGFNFLGVKLWERNKIISWMLFACAAILCWHGAAFGKQDSFIYLPLLVVGLFLCEKITDKKILYLVISVILLCQKSFWAMMIFSYGSYYVGFLLIALFVLLKREDLKKTLTVFLVMLSVCFVTQAVPKLSVEAIETDKGKIYTSQAKTVSETIGYLQNVSQYDRVVVLPEGMMINFLANRKSEDFYNSFLPLYTETFSESKLVDYYTASKPEYIILNNQKMSDYGFDYICKDYALEFCAFVAENYVQEHHVRDNFNSFLIYKKK